MTTAERRSQGLCTGTTCSNKAAEGKAKCQACLDSQKKYSATNQAEIKAKNRAKAKANKEAGLCVCGRTPVDGGRSCQGCLDKTNKWREKRKIEGGCQTCGLPAEPRKSKCAKCGERVKGNSYDYHRRAREEVFAHYGKSCACCGEGRMEFLSIDHINDDGAEHRKETKTGGVNFYIWLRKHDWPEGYQTLCMNCNTAKGFHGECPHEVERREAAALAAQEAAQDSPGSAARQHLPN